MPCRHQSRRPRLGLYDQGYMTRVTAHPTFRPRLAPSRSILELSPVAREQRNGGSKTHSVRQLSSDTFLPTSGLTGCRNHPSRRDAWAMTARTKRAPCSVRLVSSWTSRTASSARRTASSGTGSVSFIFCPRSETHTSTDHAQGHPQNSKVCVKLFLVSCQASF